MTKVNYFLLCENLLRDDKGRITLVNIFDSIHAEKLPVSPLKFTLAMSLLLNKEDIIDNSVNVTIEIYDSKKKIMVKIEGNATLTTNESNLVTSVELGGRLILESFNKHTAKLSINGKPIDELKFNVLQGNA